MGSVKLLKYYRTEIRRLKLAQYDVFSAIEIIRPVNLKVWIKAWKLEQVYWKATKKG